MVLFFKIINAYEKNILEKRKQDIKSTLEKNKHIFDAIKPTNDPFNFLNYENPLRKIGTAFGRINEIMSKVQNIFPKMREDVNLPILSLIMDEQTGKAGYLTRLEAFVDLMRRKKQRQMMKTKVIK